MRIGHVAFAVVLSLFPVLGTGCADETDVEPTASVSAGLVTIEAGKQSRAAGIKQWTLAEGAEGTVLTPVSKGAERLPPLVFRVEGVGDARVIRFRMGDSILSASADGRVLENALDARTEEVLALSKADLEAYLASDNLPYASCRVETAGLIVAFTAWTVACATSPATAGIGCVIASGALIVQAAKRDEACQR